MKFCSPSDSECPGHICSPISDNIDVLNKNKNKNKKFKIKNLKKKQLIVADCDYAESYGWFLSGGIADASQIFGIRSKALTVEVL